MVFLLRQNGTNTFLKIYREKMYLSFNSVCRNMWKESNLLGGFWYLGLGKSLRNWFLLQKYSLNIHPLFFGSLSCWKIHFFRSLIRVKFLHIRVWGMHTFSALRLVLTSLWNLNCWLWFTMPFDELMMLQL